ncbi:hypothetical protein NC653_038910 [Populus alba x Populus x berolinensis]|uniref:Uncharacterized protein n=1 Tax=Populus alba x Populus x berolinensis TaxID=444605 RepID=A0AAD6LCI6_9ROSI|nr:hypothetical protein NC653_038910 [Populus alba x Populus x berolinensis]
MVGGNLTQQEILRGERWSRGGLLSVHHDILVRLFKESGTFHDPSHMASDQSPDIDNIFNLVFGPINPPSYAVTPPSNPEHRTSIVRAAYILKPSINKMDSGLLTEPSKVGKAQPISDDPRMSILTPEWGR